MTRIIRPLPNLDNIDLRLLKVFRAVANHGGFSAAQTELNMSQSAISKRMSQLEARLGVHLCERGRGGFNLTLEGEEVLRATIRLFQALERFTSDVGGTRGQLVGDLHIGIVDAFLTNSDCRLDEAVALFNTKASEVQLYLYVEAPQDIQLGLVKERFHLGVAAFRNLPETLTKCKIYIEEEKLYCGEGSDLFYKRDDEISSENLSQANYVRQLDMSDWVAPGSQEFNSRAATADMEAMAALILSGRYIGYMPGHYARQWVKAGKMRVLKDDIMSYSSNFYVAHRANERNAAALYFLECLLKTAVHLEE